MKVGFGTDTTPQLIFPKVVGRDRSVTIVSDGKMKSSHVSQKALANISILKLYYLIETEMIRYCLLNQS